MSLEAWRLLLQALATGGVIIALVFTGKQIKLAVIAYRELHDWNRRKAAHDACAEFLDLREDMKSLDAAFGILNNKRSISLEDTIKAIQADRSIRTSLHLVLNYFESLANAIRHGVVDEGVVKSYLRTMMEDFDRTFKGYIDNQRNSGDPRVWVELRDLVIRWEHPERVPAPLVTGKSM